MERETQKKIAHLALIVICPIIAFMTVVLYMNLTATHLSRQEQIPVSFWTYAVLRDSLPTYLDGRQNQYRAFRSRYTELGDDIAQTRAELEILKNRMAVSAAYDTLAAPDKKSYVTVTRISLPTWSIQTSDQKAKTAENATLITLSDGYVVDATPTNANSRWLGVKVGERVLKIEGIGVDVQEELRPFVRYEPLYRR